MSDENEKGTIMKTIEDWLVVKLEPILVPIAFAYGRFIGFMEDLFRR